MHDRFALEVLLAPVEGGAGPDVRDDPAFLEIKDARVDARMAERDALASGDTDSDPLRAGLRDWGRVVDGATALLSARSKDLQLAAWLTEAWVRTDGFAGLAAGFALMAGLIDGYWEDGLHPQEDEDGVETRVAPLFGLFGRGETGTLLQPIKLLPLTDRIGEPVALWTIENAQAQSTRHDDPDVREGLVARRQERIAAIDDAVARASPDFAAETMAAIASVLGELDQLMAAIDARAPFGRFGTQVERPLDDALIALRAAHGATAAALTSTVAVPEFDADVGGLSQPAVPTAAVAKVSDAMTRESALATLLEVAAFFDRNEPQSIVGSGLRDIVRRAGMPMEALLRELLPDDEQRAMFLMRAGIRATPPADDGSFY